MAQRDYGIANPAINPGGQLTSDANGVVRLGGIVIPGWAYDAYQNIVGLLDLTGRTIPLPNGREPTVMPDEAVRVTSTGNGGSGGPGYISRIRCITGTSVVLTVKDNPGVDAGGTVIYSGTLSAGEEAVLSAAKVPVINGTRLTWAGSASFDVYTGQETP